MWSYGGIIIPNKVLHLVAARRVRSTRRARARARARARDRERERVRVVGDEA